MSDDTAPRVTYTLSLTRNLGDFESMRVEVGVTDSPRGTESVAAAYKRIKHFVESRVEEENEEINAQMKA